MATATMVMTLGSNYDTARAINLRTLIARMDGVYFVDFNYTNNKISMRFDPDRVSPRKLKDLVIQEEKHCALSPQQSASEVG